MDTSAVLQSIAGLLPSLPADALDDQLVVFDSLLNVSDPGQRPAAAQMLRDAAEACTDPAAAMRLENAAIAVAAGQPCALTPQGLTAAQAAAASTVSADQWTEPAFEQSAEDTEEDDDEYMDDPPPKLPHLPVKHFFRGLTLRVAKDFRDDNGRAFCEGDLLHLLTLDEDGVLQLLVRSARISDPNILENAGNAWFQPVPTKDCLEELCEALDAALSEAEEDEDLWEENVSALQDDVAACSEWLSREGTSAPESTTGRLAVEMFGKDDRIPAWMRLLFAGVKAISREKETK